MLTFNKKNFFIFLLLILVEVFIALFVHDRFIRPYVGDILVVIVLYYFSVAFLKNPPKLLPLYIFIFAFLIEVSQYFKLVDLLNIENKILRIALGSTFDIGDILCYFVGCIILFGIHYRKEKR